MTAIGGGVAQVASTTSQSMLGATLGTAPHLLHNIVQHLELQSIVNLALTSRHNLIHLSRESSNGQLYGWLIRRGYVTCGETARMHGGQCPNRFTTGSNAPQMDICRRLHPSPFIQPEHQSPNPHDRQSRVKGLVCWQCREWAVILRDIDELILMGTRYIPVCAQCGVAEERRFPQGLRSCSCSNDSRNAQWLCWTCRKHAWRQWFEQINHNRDKLLICRYRKTGNRHRVVYSRSQYYQMRHDFDFAWYYPGSRLPRRTQSVSLPLFNQSVNPQDGCLCGKGFADYSGMRNVQLCLLCMQVNVGRTNHWGQPARTYKGRPFARTARDYVLEEVP